MTTEENYRAVKAGRSALRRYDGRWGVREPFTASLFTDEQWSKMGPDSDYTRFERLLIHSVTRALASTEVDPSSPRVLFVISSTKGNIELMDHQMPAPPRRSRPEALLMGNAARTVASHFHHAGMPWVVSNACISGLSAQIAAARALRSGHYDYAIVAGAEVHSRFIVSGFQSLKALSANECRPFDADRCGLNLGEAAATMILRRTSSGEEAEGWCLTDSAVRNDAWHISSPSRTAEGCYRALRAVIGNIPADDIALINAHGTATLYNDEMEADALHRAGLDRIPVNSLKGYYGHTMGAAGVLEAILSMRAVDDHTILATHGYSESGVRFPLNISGQNRPADGHTLIKMLSGFGGCNAVVRYQKGGAA